MTMKNSGFVGGSFVWPGEIDRCGIFVEFSSGCRELGQGAVDTPEVHDHGGKHDIGKVF